MRSTQANRYYFGVVVRAIADYTGHTQEETHEQMKSLFLPRKFVVVGGVERSVPKSTTELTTAEFNAYVTQCIAFAGRELGIKIPESNNAD